jgi:hypothetical protein
MKVVCINNGPMDGAMDEWVNLTVGKTYEALGDDVSTTDFVFNIINDIGNRASYYHKRFEMIDVTRDKKIDDILND